jgi:hypothetical protein
MIDAGPSHRRADRRFLRSAANQRGGIFAWLIMSFFLVCVLLVVGGIFFVHTIKFHESGSGNDVRLETPFGSVHVSHNQGGQPETAGTPLYPGAKAMKNRENAVVDLSSAYGDRDLHIAASRWETADPIDKVQKFYEDKFPDMSVIQHTGRVEMHTVSGANKRVIVLYDRGSSTEISLASVGEPKAN